MIECVAIFPLSLARELISFQGFRSKLRCHLDLGRVLKELGNHLLGTIAFMPQVSRGLDDIQTHFIKDFE